MGVDLALDVRTHRVADAWGDLGLSEGFDVGLEISGQASALAEMLTNMNHGGKIALLGLPSDDFAIEWAKVVTHMITIQGIYGRQMFETWYLMTAMLGSGLDVSPVITDRFPAAEWETAFRTAREGVGGKVLIEWSRTVSSTVIDDDHDIDVRDRPSTRSARPACSRPSGRSSRRRARGSRSTAPSS